MFGWLSSIFTSLSSTTSSYSEEAIQSQIGDLAALLNDGSDENSTVRLWAEAGSSYGHQSSTVNLMYRIARAADDHGLTLGYTGTIEIYYDSSSADEELGKLQQLIPEVNGGTTGTVDGATVNLIALTDAPATTVNFGFTGGANAAEDYAAMLNVNYFLRLQPYNWPGDEQILFAEGGRDPVDLTEIPAVGGERFKRRLYFTDPSLYQTVPYDQYLAGDFTAQQKARLEIVRYLLGDEVQSNYQFQAAYSIKTGSLRFNQSTEFGAALICAGAMEWQFVRGEPYGKAKPVIILNFDEFGDPDDPDDSQEDSLRAVLAGNFGASESMLEVKYNSGVADIVQNFDRRRAYFRTLDGNSRFSFLNYPTTVEEVQNAVESVAGQNNHVLFIQLGRSFPAAFSNALYKSTLPPIFEGQNTANLAVNIGRPYLQVPATNATSSQRLAIYPSVTLSNYSSQAVPSAMLMVAGQVSSSPALWPSTAREQPPVVMGSFYRQYTDETPTDNSIQRYFAALKTFFASASQDKFSLAAAYLQTLLPSDELSASDADENPLDALYDKIEAAITSDNKVDLIPGIMTSGTIPDFIQDFIKDFTGSLSIQKPVLDPATKPDPLETFTLSGKTDVFSSIDVSAEIEIVFTAPDNKLTADFKFTATETWTMPAAPWMVFSDPFIKLTIPNGKLPVQATIGGKYPGLSDKDGNIDAELEIAIGGDEDYWPASMVFSNTPPAKYPSIASGYQLATGFNIVQSLPAPFNVLTDLGISSVAVEYDYKEKTVQSLAVNAASNTEDLPLIGTDADGIKLGGITVSAVVTQPKTDRKLTLDVGANFKFGPKGMENPPVVDVTFNYPDIILQGELNPDGGALTPELVVESFVPGLDLQLPEQLNPDIQEFSFTYNKPNDNLAVSMNMVMKGWDFEIPEVMSEPLFTLESVKFGISRTKDVNSGNLSAQTTILKKSTAPIGVSIGAAYDGDRSNWTFTAKTTTEVKVNDLMDEYLGKDWKATGINLPDLKDVSAVLVWGKNGGTETKAQSFEFKARTALPWKPIKALGDQFQVTFDLTMGYGPVKEEEAETSGDEEEALTISSPAAAVPVRVNGTDLVASAAEEPVKMAPYGQVSADMTIWRIHLNVKYNFEPEKQSVLVTWTDVGLTAEVKEEEGKDTIAVFSLEGETIGSIVEKFVSWATGAKFGLVSPWDILNDISLSGLKITYNFTKKKVDFTIGIGPIDLGLFKLEGITLAYNPDGNPTKDGKKSANKVEIKVNGSFVWQDEDEVSWEPDDPSTTPAPPGGGNKYFDLRLLALGQHVEVSGLTEAGSVEEVITNLRNLNIPSPPDIPLGGTNQPVFAPESSWFVGFDFGILKVEEEKKDGGSSETLPAASADNTPAKSDEGGDSPYFISLSIVFNDPKLYALRISLAGPMAKILKGLDFQIMYQQVSKNVGKYSAQIVLPDIMRKFNVGAAGITLPVFGIEIFTNGDFQVDIGFPWKQDFSRSFSVEFQAGPIPVLGSAGFYFGKLSSATTDKVPTTTKGWFNPVIVFGFGAQIGLGKSIEAGILSAGFSLTAFGIIEGVIARWLPYEGETQEGTANQLQDGYFFSLSGTVGVRGRLYGSINFAIISAELDVAISLYVKITFASYEPIPITAAAQVSVTLTVKINLGLFKISIHLSFKAHVSATFVLENPMGGPSDAPWYDPNPAVEQTPAARKLAARGVANETLPSGDDLMAEAVSPDEFNPTWSHLQNASVLNLNGWYMPVLTVAGDQAGTNAADQQMCYVVNFLLEAEAPIQADDGSVSASSAAPTGALVVEPENVARAAYDRVHGLTAMSADVDLFGSLAERVLRWTIAAGQQGPMTVEEVDALTVTDKFLKNAIEFLADDNNPISIPIDQIEDFLNNQTKISFALQQEEQKNREGQDAPTSAVFFPAAPGITLDVPSFNSGEALSYSFGDYNIASAGYLSGLKTYFNQLKVQIDEQNEDPTASAAADVPVQSVASFIFGEYFAMIGRLTLQGLRDGLRNFKLALDQYSGQSIDLIISDINKKAEHSKPDEVFSAGELFVANQTHKLANGALIQISGMTLSSPGEKSFTDLAGEAIFAGAFANDVTALALFNQSNATILASGNKYSFAGDNYITQSGDSLQTIAWKLGFGTQAAPDVAKMLTDMPALLTDQKLIRARGILHIPDFAHQVSAADATLQSIGQAFGITTDQLADANGDTVGLFDTSDPNLNVPYLTQYNVGALIDELKRTLGLQHVTAMVSRYYLHGLRLPTDVGNGNKLKANHDGLFVKKDGAYPADMGLFGLTGQTIPLPVIPDPTGVKPEEPHFSFTLTSGEGWLSFGSSGKFVLDGSNKNANWLAYSNVEKIVHGGFFSTGATNVLPLDAASVEPGRYALSHEISWQPAVVPALPHQTGVPDNARPRFWSLPNELINTPNDSGQLPIVQPVLARSDQALGITVDDPVGNWGFGTLVSFGIRRIDAGAGSTPLAGRTYEIIGASESSIVLLERLLNQVQADEGAFNNLELLYSPTSTSSDSNGWISDDQSAVLMGLTQTNLSTETNPPGSGALTAADAVTGLSNLVGSPNDFIRLLWEASITRQGGFFLTYTTGIGDSPKGLPDHVFNDRGEAEVAVLAMFNLNASTGQALANYMNVVATTQPLDLNDAALMVKAVEGDPQEGRAFDVKDTLTSYAADSYIGVGLLAELNQTVAFAGGKTLTIEGGKYQVPADPSGATPGDSLSTIAKHFGVDPQAIKDANTAGNNLPETLPPLMAIKLPAVQITTPSTDAGNTFKDLSDFFGTPIPELAAANADVEGLMGTANLQIKVGPVSLSPALRQGVAGITLERPAADLPDTLPDATWADAYLKQTFGLLGYRIADNGVNSYFETSNWGLPAGPIEPDSSTSADKVNAPAANTDTWNYSLSVPFASVLAKGDPNANPYLGIGALLQFDMQWLDIFGNKILSEFSNPKPPVGPPQNRIPQITGYTDRLVGIGQWPSIASAFLIQEAKDGPQISLLLNLDAKNFAAAGVAARGSKHEEAVAAAKLLKRAILSYTTIVNQLEDPAGVTVEMTTSVCPGETWTVPVGGTDGLLTWAKAILAYLEGLADVTKPAPSFSDTAFSFSQLMQADHLNEDQIFELTASVAFKRNASLVDGDLRTVAGVATGSTVISPWMGPLDTNTQKNAKTGQDEPVQRTLTKFAQDFKAAFASVPKKSFRIATGSNRNVFTGGGDSPVWVIQMGDKGADEPISYAITNPGQLPDASQNSKNGTPVAGPTIYAPRPISNVLKSRQKTTLIKYETGKPFTKDGPTSVRAFTGIDLDRWMGTTLSYVDELLTPRFVSPADILSKRIQSVKRDDGKEWPKALENLLNAKKSLADGLRSVMMPVFTDEDPDDQQKADIRESFYQSMLGTLGQFYLVKAGVQFHADVDAQIKRRPLAVEVPRIFGDIQTLKLMKTGLEDEESDNPNNITISAPKLDLNFKDDSGLKQQPSPYLSSLISSTSTDAKRVTLNLAYNGQYIEHEIGELDGIKDYLPSSWLSLVDIGEAAEDSPLYADLGQFEVPIVLRAFPDTPNLVNQESVTDLSKGCHVALTTKDVTPLKAIGALNCALNGATDPLDQATKWAYGFTYAMQVHYLQDEVHGTISFNVEEEADLDANAVERDLFDNLAEFVTEYPAVLADLNTYLAPVDVDSDQDDLIKAQYALEAAASMIEWVAGSATEELSDEAVNADVDWTDAQKAADAEDQDAVPDTIAEPVEFVISEDQVPKPIPGTDPVKDVQALQVSVKIEGDLPPRVGLPYVSIDGYHCERTSDPTDPNGVFLYKDDDGNYLPASVARNIAARTFVLPDLGVLERQDAKIEIYLTRNADLVPGRTIDGDFIYQTPDVTFQGPLHPTIFNDDPIDLATIYAPSLTEPVTRTFECQLAMLYTALLDNAGTDDVTMQFGLYHEYSVNPDAPMIRLPVFLMPPTKVSLTSKGEGIELKDLVVMQVQGWTNWFSANWPEITAGRLSIDLTVMSDLTQRPMPILRLTGLYVNYANINDVPKQT